jgi:putative transposase
VKYHRYTQTEKMEIIRIVEDSEIGVKPTLNELNIHSSTFYHWCNAYREHGYDGLAIKEPERNKFWNKIPDKVKEEIVFLALKSKFI